MVGTNVHVSAHQELRFSNMCRKTKSDSTRVRRGGTLISWEVETEFQVSPSYM